MHGIIWIVERYRGALRVVLAVACCLGAALPATGVAQEAPGWPPAPAWRPLLPSDWGNAGAAHGARRDFVAPAPRGDLRGDIINNSHMRNVPRQNNRPAPRGQ